MVACNYQFVRNLLYFSPEIGNDVSRLEYPTIQFAIFGYREHRPHDMDYCWDVHGVWWIVDQIWILHVLYGNGIGKSCYLVC
jgi:hypothetical protein